MRRRSVLRLGAGTFASVAAAACSPITSKPRTDSSNASSSSHTATKPRKLLIGAVIPQSGQLATIGLALRNGIELALQIAEAELTAAGIAVNLHAVDGAGSRGVGKNAATKLVSNDDVFAVIGGVTDLTASAMLPVMTGADLALISPGSGGPQLARGSDYKSISQRIYTNLFRVRVADDKHGEFIAQSLIEQNVTSLALIIEQGSPAGRLAEHLSDAFITANGQVSSLNEIDERGSNRQSILDDIAQNPPSAVYIGTYPERVFDIVTTLHERLPNTYIVTPDTMYGLAYSQRISPSSMKLFTTLSGLPVEKSPLAGKVLSALEDGGFTQAPTAYTLYAYDAARAALTALSNTDMTAKIADLRADVVQQIGALNIPGALGPLSFDAFGERYPASLSLYEAGMDDAWGLQRFT